MRYLVMDFGGTLVKYLVMDEERKVYLREEKSAPVQSREAFLDFIQELYERLSGQMELGGIAISMPGVIDPEKGQLHSSGAYTSLIDMNVKEEVSRRVPLRVSVENDGKCGALAEIWGGNLSQVEDGVVLILGTGIAGGIVQGKRVIRGESLSAGEFSFCLVGEGNRVEDMALAHCTVSALLYRAMLAKGIDINKNQHYEILHPYLGDNSFLSSLNEDPAYDSGMNGHQFFQLLEEGDEDIERVYREFIKRLAHMIFNIQITLAPQKVLIGGGISRQERLLGDVFEAFQAITEDFPLLHLELCLDRCKYGNEANQYGALYHFLQEQGFV